MSTNVDPGATGPERPADEPFGLKHPTVVPTNFEADPEPEPDPEPEDR
jgi:hypothetical protein